MSEQDLKYTNSDEKEKTLTYKGGEIKYSSKHLIIIGSNGSGKSALIKNIGINSPGITLISAHKNLLIDQGRHRAVKDEELSSSAFTSLQTGPLNLEHIRHRKALNINNFIQDDFNKNIELILRTYINETMRAFNDGKKREQIKRKLDVVMSAWNAIFMDRELLCNDSKIQVKHNNGCYDIEGLSDGERSALYLLIKVALSQEEEVLILIDEPELYLNISLVNELVDSLESIRPDCSFVYLTHDLDFATSRQDTSLFWIKSYNHPGKWSFEEIRDKTLPDKLTAKIIGSKKQKILFVESVKNKDAFLYQKLYSDFKVVSVGNVNNVISYTRALNSRGEKFNKSYYGLIDRDLRVGNEIAKLENDKIFCIPTAIYENLFLMEAVVNFVLEHAGDPNVEQKFYLLTKNVKEKINSKNFHLKYIKYRAKRQFCSDLDSTLDMDKFSFELNIESYKKEIGSLKSKNYEEILKHFNQKDLKACVQVLGSDWESWRKKVLNIFNTDKKEELRKIFLKFMPKINEASESA